MKRRADRPDCKLVRIEASTETPPRKRYICACGYEGSWERDGWRHVGRKAHWYTAGKLATWNWRAHAGIIAAWKTDPRRKPVAAAAATVAVAGQTTCKLLRLDPEGDARRYVCACGKVSSPIHASWCKSADVMAKERWDVHRASLDGWRRRRAGMTKALTADVEPSLLQRIANSAQATGRTLQEFVRDALLQSVNAASVPAGIKPGVLVEWEPEYASGTMRAAVTRIADGRVFVAIERRRSASARKRKPDPEAWFEPDEVHRLRVVPAPTPNHCPAQTASAGVPEVSSPPPTASAAPADSPMISVEEPPRFELGNGGFADHC